MWHCRYSGGVVLSLLATPLVAKPFGWPAAYQLYVVLGLLWAVRLKESILECLLWLLMFVLATRYEKRERNCWLAASKS